MPNKAAALAQLRELRKSGKSRLTSYQVEEAEDLYDEVDEEGYKKVVRGRLDQDDFVVDDNGGGYADDGREEWNDRRPAYETESDDDAAPLRGKAAKRKREEDAEKSARNNASISNYFNAANTKSGPKPKAKVVATADDAAFMADLLGDMEQSASSGRRAPMKPVKNESRRKTRVLSPPVQEARKPSRRYDAPSPTHARENTSPAPVSDDDGLPLPINNDVVMSDINVPSSPIARAVERKGQTLVKQEEESDDDMMEVAAVVARTTDNTTSVNIAGSRPAIKVIKQEKTDYPTPESSSPTRAPASDPIDASSWNAITSKLNVMSSPSADTSPVGKLQEKDVVEEDGSLRFFWTDYLEMNGSLLLFGKVKNKSNDTYASAFVKVDNVLRKLYFLPREHKVKNSKKTDEEVDMGDVYQEVDSLMSRYKVNMHKIKPSERKYAFELPGVPRQAEYLKLLYPYDKPALPVDLQGETFSHVFGTNTSIFEQFVLWKSIMGPCWLKIENANFNAVTNASWCKLELQVTKPNDVSPLGDTDNLEAPPLTMMSIAIRTALNVKENKQEIIMASARIYKDIQLSDTTPPEKLPCQTITILRPPGDGFPAGFRLDVEKHPGTVKMEKSEVGVLSLFMAHIQRFDPDVLAGHRLDEDYSILLSRLKQRNIPGWHRIGRLRRSEWPKNMGKGGGSFFVERQIASGRLLCDLANDMGKSMMTKCQSWSLAEMCELVLGKGNIRREIDNETALKTWATSREGLMNYVRHAEADTYFVAAIALKVQMLPLTKVLTNLAGNSWARTLSGTRAERNEYILLHEFTRNKYICPDKVFGKSKKEEQQPEDGEEVAETKKKDKYKGGLVFEPEKGLYDRVVLVMDFNSLYPSIIQEYNICFTTVERAGFTEEDEGVPDAPQADQELGVLPRLIAKLVNRRREVKKLMKDKSATSDQLATWDIKQMALKLTANSMYGCLGYTKSRFYARPLAVLTTFKGREILRSTKELAESKQLQVIYGDTDSVMINTNVDNIQEALRVGNDFKRSVNERYKLLEIDIDNVFRRVLLHAKKKYAAINMVEVNGKFVEKLEVKGLDMRRREYCALSKETSSNLLNMLLSGEEPEVVVEKIHDYLRELADKMREFSVPVQKYTIFTQLSKNPQDYPNAKSMPAVQVALKLAAKGKNVRAKDVMSFIITGDNSGSQERASSNAFPPDEVLKSNSELKPDIDYYLHKQILPPVERLCQPIAFTNITRLAGCLGLDTSKYRISTVGSNSNPQDELIQPLDSQVPDHIRFRDCAPLNLLCLACRKPFSYRAVDEDAATVSHAGIKCPSESCGHVMKTLTASAQTEQNIRQLSAKYYEGWLVCDDADCGCRTRQVNVYGTKCLGPQGLGRGCMGRMSWEMTEKQFYNQLLYWERAWDVSKAKERATGTSSSGIKVESVEREKIAVLAEVNRERFETVRKVVRGYLDKSGRQWVDMGSLFKFAF